MQLKVFTGYVNYVFCMQYNLSKVPFHSDTYCTAYIKAMGCLAKGGEVYIPSQRNSSMQITCKYLYITSYVLYAKM
jgi:hypothetical protein